MATGDLLSCRNTNHSTKFGYASFLAGRKRAHKSSKGAKGLNIKKRITISLDDDEESQFVYSSNRIGELISGCGNIYDYECLDRINHGSYGTVYRARHTKTEEIVAVKKELHGLSTSSLMEIDILRSLKHPSIVEYKQVVTDDHDGVYIVMEYSEYDLREYMTKRPLITLLEIKRLMKELLQGVEFLHKNHVMHRDLKPSNILINSKGKLKICDFGMSRQFSSMSDRACMTPNVCTLWYRAPELLLGTSTYSSAIDMWSVGCIMGEFFLRGVLFEGDSELEQLQIIVRTLQQPHNLLYDKFVAITKLEGGPTLTEAGFELLCQLLAYNPNKRITAQDALSHVWFDELSH